MRVIGIIFHNLCFWFCYFITSLGLLPYRPEPKIYLKTGFLLSLQTKPALIGIFSIFCAKKALIIGYILYSFGLFYIAIKTVILKFIYMIIFIYKLNIVFESSLLMCNIY